MRVLKRIGELNLNDLPAKQTIKDAEDYALHLLAAPDIRHRGETFRDLLNRSFGRAPVAVIGFDGDKPSGDLADRRARVQEILASFDSGAE